MSDVCEHCGQTIKSKRFKKPTLLEVSEYCISRNNGINPESFIDHYESKGWVIGKSPMKSWQAAIRTWERGNNGSASTGSGGTRRGGESARDARNREAKAEEQRILNGGIGHSIGRINKPNPIVAIGTGSGYIQGEVIPNTQVENR